MSRRNSWIESQIAITEFMISTFGTLADGREVHAVSLGSPNLLQAQVLTYGGILRELTFFLAALGIHSWCRCRISTRMCATPAFVGIVAGGSRIESPARSSH